MKKAKLEAAGYTVGNVAEFLELTLAESALVEARLALSNALRLRRQAQGISQNTLAKLINSSQSRIAKIEAADPSVSLDLMARAFLETGASLEDLGHALMGVTTASSTDPSETGPALGQASTSPRKGLIKSTKRHPKHAMRG